MRSPSRTFHGLCRCVPNVQSLDSTRQQALLHRRNSRFGERVSKRSSAHQYLSPVSFAGFFLCNLAGLSSVHALRDSQCQVKSRSLQLQSQLRTSLCSSEGSMRPLFQRENTTTDLQSCFQFQVQVAVHPSVARSRSSHLHQSHLHQQLRCFCNLVHIDQVFHISSS